jgi:hypothetical protein
MNKPFSERRTISLVRARKSRVGGWPAPAYVISRTLVSISRTSSRNVLAPETVPKHNVQTRKYAGRIVRLIFLRGEADLQHGRD